MISDKFCAEQLSRLAHLERFPKAKAGVSDMICALQASNTEAIAHEVIDGWIDTVTAERPTCPMPADIRRLAYEANEREAIKLAESMPTVSTHAHCANCQDFGISESAHADDFNSVASWCDCSEGQRRKRIGLRLDRNGQEDITFLTPERINHARVKLCANFPNWATENPFRRLLESRQMSTHVDWTRY